MPEQTTPSSGSTIWTRSDGHPDLRWLNRMRDAMDWWEGQPVERGVTSSVTGLGAVAAAERRLGELHEGRRFLLTPNATYAVELALRVVGVSAGDDVLVASGGWPASAAVVRMLGATVVDLQPSEDPSRMAAFANCAATPTTKAAIVAHGAGPLVDVEAVRLALPGVTVIEDAAAVFGRRRAGRLAGTSGDFAVFSFGPGKRVDAGEGGALAVADELWSRVVARSAHPVRQALEGVPQDAEHPAMRPHPLMALLVAHALRDGIPTPVSEAAGNG